MTTVADLHAWLEDFAPSRLAESWDNVGLLFGDPASEVSRVMTCLTVTPRSADEAISEGAGAIVSHHPVLFKATKSLRADRPVGRVGAPTSFVRNAYEACRNDTVFWKFARRTGGFRRNSQ